MSEFPRLLHSGSPVQRAMLEAALTDAPSEASQKRLLLALGGVAVSIGALAQGASSVGTSSSPTASVSLSSPAASGVAETAASTGASSLAAPAASALAVPASAIGTALVAKWVVIATLSVAAVGAGVVVGRGIARNTPPWRAATLHVDERPARGAALSRDARSEPSPRIERSAAVAAPTLPLPPPNTDLGSRLTEVQGATHSPASRPSANRRVADALTVGDETALVERARDALRHGDPAGCLSLLEIRRKGVRGGVLAPEATILRIDALRALGQRERAAQEAVRFVHDYPDSPLVDRIRDLLDASKP